MPDDGLKKDQTIIINEIEASSRDEMVCPECGKHSIEEHPSASEYPTKKAEILKASQCTNPNCNKGLLHPDEVDKQYSPKGIKSQLFTRQSLVQLAVLLVGVLLVVGFFFGNPLSLLLEEPKVTVSGSVISPNGEPVQNATVSLTNASFKTTTNGQGKYTINEIPQGNYTIKISPPEKSKLNSFRANIKINKSGLSIKDEFIPKKLYTINETTLTTKLPGDITVSESFTAQNTTKTITYVSPENREKAIVELYPIKTSELKNISTYTINIGESKTINTKGTIVNSEITGVGTVSTEQFTVNKETNSSGKASIEINGTKTPLSGKIILGSGAGTNTRKKKLKIQSGNSKTISINGTIIGSMDMIIRGGAMNSPQSKSGSWSPGDGPLKLNISEKDAPSTTTLSISNNITTEQKTITGELNQKTQKLTFDIAGSLNPTESILKFNGGDIQSEKITSGSISASGKNGTEIITTELKTIQNTGTYELKYTFNQTNENYVSGGYTINGTKTKVTQSSGNINVKLKSGDTIGLWIKAEKEQLERVNHSYSGPIEVTDVDVTDTNLDDPGSVGLRATVKNTGDQADYTSIVAYKDGTTWDTGTADLNPGETKQIVFKRVNFNSKGVYAIQVNNSRVIEVTVGDASLKYGEGTLSTDLNYLAETGSVKIDTNGDGSANCTAIVSKESCNLTLNKGENTITVTQENISNVNYTLEYTARYGAKNIKADLNNDGTYEINHPGVLSEGNTISKSITYPAGTHKISIVTGNNESINYTLEWTQSGTINSPTVLVNGSEVVNVNETYQGEREFTVSSSNFNDGSNTITLNTKDNGEHTVILEWTERGKSTYPKITLDNTNTVLCTSAEFAGDNTCMIKSNNLKPGNKTITFTNNGQVVPNTKFTFKYTARSIPLTLELINTKTDATTLFTRTNAQNINSNGSWSHTKETTIKPDSTYTVKSNTSSNMNLNGKIELKITTKRSQAIKPKIVITHSDGSSTTISVPQSKLNKSGKLTKPVTIAIPKNKFKRGKNTLKFTSKNKGVYRVRLVGTDDI